MSVHLLDLNALFLHIPKTGGSWVEKTLGEAGLRIEQPATIEGVTYRHCLVSMFKDRYPFVFTFVRHPLRWYESWWKFQADIWREFEPGVWHPQRTLEACRADDFSEWLMGPDRCLGISPTGFSRIHQ
jgi:hypothetical protein